MKKLFLSTFLLIAAMSASAQLLWKISGNGAKGESYLLATHHIAPVTVLDSIPGLNDALKSVETVYGEIDMSEMRSPSAQQVIIGYAMAPADSTLTKVFDKAQIDSINAILAKYTGGMATVAQMDQLKPAMVNTQIAMLQSMVEFPQYNGQEQLDETVQTRGRADGKKVKGFETIDEQMSMLMGSPISVQIKDLMQTVRTDDKAAAQAHALADAYLTGNLEKIGEIIFEPETGMDQETAQRLLFDRNECWIEKLKATLPAESVFIAVGAGHLVGEKGLLKQLQKLGYTVEPVK